MELMRYCVKSLVRRNTANRNTICHASWSYHHGSARDMDVFLLTSVSLLFYICNFIHCTEPCMFDTS